MIHVEQITTILQSKCKEVISNLKTIAVKSEPETSGKESDEMEEPEQSNNVEEEKKETKISSPNLPKIGKSKKRRIVTKTYEDEDGFISNSTQNHFRR